MLQLHQTINTAGLLLAILSRIDENTFSFLTNFHRWSSNTVATCAQEATFIAQSAAVHGYTLEGLEVRSPLQHCRNRLMPLLHGAGGANWLDKTMITQSQMAVIIRSSATCWIFWYCQRGLNYKRILHSASQGCSCQVLLCIKHAYFFMTCRHHAIYRCYFSVFSSEIDADK